MSLLARLRHASLPATVALVFVFLYLPAAVIVLFSFDSSAVSSWPPSGFTLDWYQRAFDDQVLVAGLQNSLTVAVVSTTLALLIGVPAGIGFDRFDYPGKVAFQRLLVLPFLMPGVISGIALLTMFLDLGVQLSLGTVIVAHTSMLIAVFVIQIGVALAGWDRSAELAAQDLGASELRTFAHVLLPNLRGAILGACLLGVTVSLDEVARTFFLTGQESTLPMVIWGELHRQITPKANAMGTVVLLGSLLALIVWSRIAARSTASHRNQRR
jgi:spermidine/putrescine transport system permease protein